MRDEPERDDEEREAEEGFLGMSREWRQGRTRAECEAKIAGCWRTDRRCARRRRGAISTGSSRAKGDGRAASDLGGHRHIFYLKSFAYFRCSRPPLENSLRK